MNCNDVQLLLNDADAAMRHALEPRNDALERHLESCADCRGEWHAQAAVAALPIAPPSTELPDLARCALPRCDG